MAIMLPVLGLGPEASISMLTNISGRDTAPS
jgi:hypothetical protein